MFYVMLRAKKGKWAKTMFGAKRREVAPFDYGDITSENFKGIPFKVDADHALREATERNPKGTYRLVYSEEEL